VANKFNMTDPATWTQIPTGEDLKKKQMAQMQSDALSGFNMPDFSLEKMSVQGNPEPQPMAEAAVAPNTSPTKPMPKPQSVFNGMAATSSNAEIEEPKAPSYEEMLQSKIAERRDGLDNFSQKRFAEEQSGIDDLTADIQKYQEAKSNIDWRPLAAMAENFGGPAVYKLATDFAPESPEVKRMKLQDMKKQLQAAKGSLTGQQFTMMKSQLDSLLDEAKTLSAEKREEMRAARLAKSAAQKQENSSFDDEAKLRDTWLKNDLTKNTQKVSEAYEKVKASADDPSAAGDLSLIFGYMKMLDPGSVVREGEFATAQNAAGIPDRISNAYNRALNGERLNQNQRADFINQANNTLKSQVKNQDLFDKQISELAKRRGFNPDNIVLKDLFPALKKSSPVAGDLQSAAAAELAKRRGGK